MNISEAVGLAVVLTCLNDSRAVGLAFVLAVVLTCLNISGAIGLAVVLTVVLTCLNDSGAMGLAAVVAGALACLRISASKVSDSVSPDANTGMRAWLDNGDSSSSGTFKLNPINA